MDEQTNAFPPGKLTARAKTDVKQQEKQTRPTTGRAKVMVATPIMMKSRSLMTSHPTRAVPISAASPRSDILHDKAHEGAKTPSNDVLLPELPQTKAKNLDFVSHDPVQEGKDPEFSVTHLPPPSPAVEATNNQVMVEIVVAKSKTYGKKPPLTDRVDAFLKTVDHKNSTVLPQIVSAENWLHHRG